MRRMKQRLGVTLATALVLFPLMTPLAHAKTTSAAEMIKPHEASYGFYVDTYLNNTADNKTIYNNPAVGVTSEFYKYWSPEKGVLNPTILNMSIAATAKASQNRTVAEEHRSFLTDRRNLPYTIVSGFGPYEDAFIKNSGAQTSYHGIPDKPVDKYDKAPKVPWANPNSRLGSIVQLINLNRLPYGKSGFPKKVYKYVRPYRQSPSTVIADPYLVDFMAAAPQTDFDYPSGHGSAAFESGPTLGYVFPERFQQLVTRSSEIAYDRMLVGRHSALAVMGARSMGTAVTAGILNDAKNADLIKKAYQEAHSDALLHSPLITNHDEFGNYQENKKNYRYRLTFGLPQIGDKNIGFRVPKGAEVLLATRLPYLSHNQRRMVLATTELPSGYPVLDDAEGWGRLDLFSAANGYGALPAKTTVTMDATKGGFNAKDVWRNDIKGTGKLIKQGSGDLTLKGDNSFKGGLQVNGGNLNLAAKNAAGSGQLKVQGGTLATSAAVKLQRGYQQTKRGTLALTVTKATALKIKGKAQLAGTLRLNNVKGAKNHQALITFGSRQGKFLNVIGAPKGWHLQYNAHSIALVRG